MKNWTSFRTITLLLLGVFLTPPNAHATDAGKGMIANITRHCEKAVQNYCQDELCKKRCERMRSQSLKKRCEIGCDNPNASCKITLSGRGSLNLNPEADPTTAKQVNEMFTQCVAEHRDPEGLNSGRRIFEKEQEHPGEGWKEVRTPSWTKETGEKSGRQAHIK